MSVRTLRLASGLVLALYVTGHLLNHSLGVISVDAQEAVRKVVSPLWRSVPGTLLLYTALLVHPVLGLYALWRRETLRMPSWELAQLALGLAIPLLLIPHVFATRVSASMLDTDTTYALVIEGLSSKPENIVRQTFLVLIVWSHLMVGLHYWLRVKSNYRRWLVVAYPFAVMVPLLALLGFWGASVELRSAAAAQGRAGMPAAYGSGYDAVTPGGYDAAGYGRAVPDAARHALLETRKDAASATVIALLALVLLARMARRFLRDRRGVYRIFHSNGRSITAPIGQSLLEALREAGIPHASVCGGRARCTTCRVRVGASLIMLPPPGPAEVHALERIDAAPDVRLACQLRPQRDVHITPLLPAGAGAAQAGAGGIPGRERVVVVMFVDLRESSRLGEQRLPYDVFFILNRFFAEMADALRETRGYYSTFNGDGFMALYGISTDVAQGCRDAMRGAIAVSGRLAQINAALASELRHPLRAGISVHTGEAIVGTMGPPATPILSALGDTVNVAARLEAETKVHRCTLVVSAACARAAEMDFSAFPEHIATVRGREQPVSYYAIADTTALAPLLRLAEERFRGGDGGVAGATTAADRPGREAPAAETGKAEQRNL